MILIPWTLIFAWLGYIAPEPLVRVGLAIFWMWFVLAITWADGRLKRRQCEWGAL